MNPAEIRGGLSALVSFGIWAMVPLYWRELNSIFVWEVFFHRILWTTVALIFMVLFFERRELSFEKIKKQSFNLVSASLLIGANWFVFIWAVANGYIIETSVGYFVSPILKVFLGRLIFGEKIDKPATVAIILAIMGIIPLFVYQVEAPWVSIVLALTFGLYGVVKKKISIRPNSSLLIESGLTLIIFTIYNYFFTLTSFSGFSNASSRETFFLVFSFAPTLVPLYFYAIAVRRLKLSTIGFFQYIAPIGQFLLGYYVFEQNFTYGHKLCFSFLVPALLIFIGRNIYGRGLRGQVSFTRK